jgi:hypothetical protein
MDIEEIDAFVAEPKHLQGPLPQWRVSTRPGEYEATWNIEDSIGIVRAQLRFRCPKANRSCPSVSLVFRGSPIWRIDLELPDVWKLNPLDAQTIGLPARLQGSRRWRPSWSISKLP